MSLTVASVFVKGEYPYTVDYVVRLKAMVTRWIDRPFSFVCLTDRPWLLPSDIETAPIAKLPNCFAYWTKLELFNPARNWNGRVLYLDLDTLIVAPLAPILNITASLALTDDPPRPGQKSYDSYGRRIVRKFNSSVMLWDGGTHTKLYTEWTPDIAKLLSGDQDFLAEKCPDAFGMSRQWFPRVSEVRHPPFDVDAKIILSKHPKNDVLAKSYDWFAPLWGAA